MGSAAIEFDTSFEEDKLNEMFEFDPVQTAQAVAEAVLVLEKCPSDAEISLFITDSEGIRTVNRETRDLDAVTDVLSFPVFQYMEPGNFGESEGRDAECLDPVTGRLMLGDILINADRVISQSEEYGHSRKREFAFLVAHSMLHLIGYDHMTEDDESIMNDRQEAVLNSLNITREDTI